MCMYKTLNAVLAVTMKKFIGAVVGIREWDTCKRLHVTKLILFSGNLKCYIKVSLAPKKKKNKYEFVVSLINLQWHEEQKVFSLVSKCCNLVRVNATGRRAV